MEDKFQSGYVAPLTSSGTLRLASGVDVSCYAGPSALTHALSHFMLAPLRAVRAWIPAKFRAGWVAPRHDADIITF